MNNGLIQTMTAREVEDRNLAEHLAEVEEAEAAAQDSSDQLVSKLSSYCDEKWTAAKEAKISVEDAMVKSIHQKRGEYEATKLSEIRAAEQPEIFMNITDTKCRNASAWIKDTLFMPTGRIFGVDPTPLPELPPDIVEKIQSSILNQYIAEAVSQVQQTGQPIQSDVLRQAIIAKSEEIKKRVQEQIIKESRLMADDIEDKIDDDFTEGGFYKALEEVIDDITSLKAGFIKGPIFRKTRTRKSVRDERGVIKRQIVETIIPEYERRSPFSIFPFPRSTGINAGGLFDVIFLRPKQLYDLIGVEGFNEEEIRAVISEFTAGTLKNDWLGLSEAAKEGLGETKSDAGDSAKEENIYCLELWDEIPGSLLLEWGMSAEDITDKDDSYSCCVWKIGNHIIKAMLNYDVLGRKPFSKTSFQVENDSFWGGKDVPEKIADCQQVCNACARNILANVGIASLPQVGLNIDRLEPNASRKMWNGRIWPMTEEQMSSGVPPIAFYYPPLVANQLIQVYQTFSRIADEHSGVPAFTQGAAAGGGVDSTSSGLHQLIQQAARGIKAVIRNIDNDIIIPILEMHYDYILDNQEVIGLIGDYKISAKGTAALLAKEQQATRMIEYLGQTSNPVDMQLIGPEARRKMLIDVAAKLGIDVQLPQTPVPQIPVQQQPPSQNPQTIDNAGDPVQGTETRQFNAQRPRLEASTPGQSGGANA
jgi:hypothetical protein